MKFKLSRPTSDTPLHVDWSWFERNHLNAESIVRNQLCYTCHQRFGDGQEVEQVDYIDPTSGEVFRMDSLRECILTHCQWERDYINGETPLVQAVLRLFLSTNNQPMTVTEIAQRLGRHDGEAILRVLTASGVQNGIVPVR